MHIPNVLIVDDSKIIHNALKKILNSLELNIEEACNGNEAYEKIISNNFDLIITDIEMPGISGFELCKKLKSLPKTKSLPIIILSSYDKEKDIELGFQTGAAAYVSKNNLQDELPKIINDLLQKYILFKNKKVLVIETSDIIQNLINETLSKEGLIVINKKNGKQGLNILNKEKIDLIIIQFEMLDINGINFCKTVHSMKQLKSIPIITMCNKDTNVSVKRIIQAGSSACLVKPFDMNYLIILIENLLSNHFIMLLKEKERLELEQTFILSSMTSLIEALEARDHYTRGHSENVSKIVEEMAIEMDADKNEIENIKIAAKLHDIGKIGIPDKVLLKSEPLTKEEFTIIKRHPIIGAKIIQPISNLKNAIPVILNHHERFDGKGYPEGLKGGNIPLWARMTAIADVYDACINDRAYREAIPREKILEYIKKSKETHFCPECVDLFLKLISKHKIK